MLLVALPENTGEALAASGTLALARGYSSASLAVVCGRKAAPWFEDAPKTLLDNCLSEPEIANKSLNPSGNSTRVQLQLQWQLYPPLGAVQHFRLARLRATFRHFSSACKSSSAHHAKISATSSATVVSPPAHRVNRTSPNPTPQ